jgi:FdhD protein
MWEAKRDLGYTRYSLQRAERFPEAPVIGETRWTLYVNRQRWVTFMCTPQGIHHLALGFMLVEGVITGLSDVLQLKVYEAPNRVYWLVPALRLERTLTMRGCEDAVGVIDARVTGQPVPDPAARVLTSGCSGGITFDDLSQEQAPLDPASGPVLTVDQLTERMRELTGRAQLYQQAGGVHTSALSDGQRLLALAEDVGRHNTLDKLRGRCLLEGMESAGKVILTTGRISSEMLTKARAMQVPVVVSRTSPTALAVELAEAWNITVVGYARANQMNVYSGEHRSQLTVAPPVDGRAEESTRNPNGNLRRLGNLE